jgi:hypothetical protein
MCQVVDALRTVYDLARSATPVPGPDPPRRHALRTQIPLVHLIALAWVKGSLTGRGNYVTLYYAA